MEKRQIAQHGVAMEHDAPATAPVRAKAGSPSTEPPLLSVIIPVYNEVRTVGEVLRRVLAVPYEKQVIVVDDGSTDGTAQWLQNWKAEVGFVLLVHWKNRGKGAAVRTGLEAAEAPFTIIQDADLEYDPGDYRKLIEPLVSGEAAVVFGSRRLGHTITGRDLLNPYYHGVTLLNLCVRLLYGARITDEATCYKAFRTDVLRAMRLDCHRFEFCAEVAAKACRMRLAIHEVPIRYTPRSRKEGKKLRLRDGIDAVRTLWKWRRWTPPTNANLRPMAAISSKAR